MCQPGSHCRLFPLKDSYRALEQALLTAHSTAPEASCLPHTLECASEETGARPLECSCLSGSSVADKVWSCPGAEYTRERTWSG